MARSPTETPAWKKRVLTYKRLNAESDRSHQDAIAYRIFRGLGLSKPSKDVYAFEGQLGLNLDEAMPLWNRAAIILSTVALKGASLETQDVASRPDKDASARFEQTDDKNIILFTRDRKTNSFYVYMTSTTSEAVLNGLEPPFYVVCALGPHTVMLRQDLSVFIKNIRQSEGGS